MKAKKKRESTTALAERVASSQPERGATLTKINKQNVQYIILT